MSLEKKLLNFADRHEQSFNIQAWSQKQRMKWLAYHVYWWYWSDAVYKYVDIHNSWFNCRGKKQNKTQITDRDFS